MWKTLIEKRINFKLQIRQYQSEKLSDRLSSDNNSVMQYSTGGGIPNETDSFAVLEQSVNDILANDDDEEDKDKDSLKEPRLKKRQSRNSAD